MEKYVFPALAEHIDPIAQNMSPADVAEAEAAVGLGPFSALKDSFESSVLAWTGMVDDRPVCMFGVSAIDILGGIGCPWLLGTPEIRRHAKTFLKLNRQYIPKMLALFPRLENLVDARHTVAIGWLKRLGFQFADRPIAHGVWQMDFFYFWMDRPKTMGDHTTPTEIVDSRGILASSRVV